MTRPRLTYRRRLGVGAYEQRTVELDDAGHFRIELGGQVALDVTLAAARIAARHDPLDFHLEETR